MGSARRIAVVGASGSGYERKLGDLVLRRADTVVWLDYPLPLTLRRLWRRTLERIRGDVELWAILSHRRFRRELPDRFARHRLEVVRLTSPAATERWLTSWRASVPPRR